MYTSTPRRFIAIKLTQAYDFPQDMMISKENSIHRETNKNEAIGISLGMKEQAGISILHPYQYQSISIDIWKQTPTKSVISNINIGLTS